MYLAMNVSTYRKCFLFLFCFLINTVMELNLFSYILKIYVKHVMNSVGNCSIDETSVIQVCNSGAVDHLFC